MPPLQLRLPEEFCESGHDRGIFPFMPVIELPKGKEGRSLGDETIVLLNTLAVYVQDMPL